MGLAYFVGYERRSFGSLVSLLRENRVTQVVDVRENASSRRAGFSADELRESLLREGIGYRHLPELGCREADRRALRHGGSREGFYAAYRTRLAGEEDAFRELVTLVEGDATAILCTEREARDCHRFVLAERLASLGWAVRFL